MLVLTGLIGGGGLSAFMLFLFVGSLNLVSLGLRDIQLLLLDAVLCLAFFIQHSGMARRSFYQMSGRFLSPQFGGPIYAIASGVVVLALVFFWQESSYILLSPQGLVRWAFRASFLVAIGCVLWALSTGFFALYRLQSNIDDLRGRDKQKAPLITHGPYRWVRHPLYLSALVLLWSYPDLTLDRLLLNLLFSVWVIAGTLLEERKLLATYGEDYRNYQSEVPMMIPWRFRPALWRQRS